MPLLTPDGSRGDFTFEQPVLPLPGHAWHPDVDGADSGCVDYYVTQAHVYIVRRVKKDASGTIISSGHGPSDFARDLTELTTAVAGIAAKYGPGGSNVATYPQDAEAYVVPDHVTGWYVLPEAPKAPPVF